MPELYDITKSNVVPTAGLSIHKAAGSGIKVDNDNPTWGWKDLTGKIEIHSPGGSDPAYTTYSGPLKAYKFNSVGDEVFINFHMPHDWAPDTDLHLHVHWSHNDAGTTTGSVTWEYDVLYAKGHTGGAFDTLVSGEVAQAQVGQYMHMIAENQLSASTPAADEIDTGLLEVDGVLLVRIALKANTMDSGADPFMHFADIHYQSTQTATKNKAPNFYS